MSEAYLQKCVCRNEKTQWQHILGGVHLVCERSTVPVDCYQAVNIGQMRQPARIAATSIECKLLTSYLIDAGNTAKTQAQHKMKVKGLLLDLAGLPEGVEMMMILSFVLLCLFFCSTKDLLIGVHET